MNNYSNKQEQLTWYRIRLLNTNKVIQKVPLLCNWYFLFDVVLIISMFCVLPGVISSGVFHRHRGARFLAIAFVLWVLVLVGYCILEIRKTIIISRFFSKLNDKKISVEEQIEWAEKYETIVVAYYSEMFKISKALDMYFNCLLEVKLEMKYGVTI